MGCCSAKNLISDLLTTDAERRLTASQALEHEWITDSKKAQKGTLTLTRKNLMKHHGTRLKVRFPIRQTQRSQRCGRCR